jgi:UDP-glucose 4-epimerase
MRVLVTGGAGYIGSVVCAQLLEAGHQVTVLDNLSNGHAEAVPEGAELHVGETSDLALLDRLLPGVEAVMHFAASIEVGESMQNPIKHFRNNTGHAFLLLEAMLKHRVGKLVFSSTAAVYGTPDRVPITESDPIRPSSPYGESKAMVERALSWIHSQNGLRYASLRYFNAAGCSPDRGEDHQPESHLIPILLEVALGRREQVAIFGDDYPTRDGTAVRDYVHVEDLASAHLLALQAMQQHDRLIFNLGNGQGFTVKEVLDVARKVTGHPIPALVQGRRAGDPAELVASSQAIRDTLGWKPRYPDLESIVASAWAWRSAHPDGYTGASQRLPRT